MKTVFLVFSLLAVGFVFAADSADSTENVDSPTPKDVKPWKKFDFRKREPEFLKDLSQEAKTAYFGIKFNPELTKAEKTEKLKNWADNYDVEEGMKKFLDDKKSDCEKKKQERKENYERLGDLIEKADKILEDQDNTWIGANEKLDALIKDENREVSKAFQSFYPFVGRDNEGSRHHGHGHGHRFHNGRRFGRNIGHGASPRQDFGIGSGISMNQRPPHGRNEAYDPYGQHQGNHHHKKHHGF
uniref:DUF148 domain-containing protein n=1 Tax=Caenorhabditis tropicalis TaxID=1561998 RepID=A0A1I7V0B6_9PELO